ncbi:multidrug DMT transporter permease [[Pantoea] beijingensis]|uniref:Multidrug DMT transporter permease n=1 Tax=[Pantoea] beijingensis TaxID=1324864 RepID=A0A443I920_9GAMM|nr:MULTISPECIES: DMT family transporter [Erwiniaceae]RWR00681.1 multidrug DMT transporter permease [[Pantoea] beijingensis]
MGTNQPGRIVAIALFCVVALTWGTTWLAMKIAVESVPPLFATGIRFMCASPLLLLLAWYKKAPLLFPKGNRFFQLMVAVFYFAIPFTLMIYGESYTPASLAAIIFAMMPVAVLGASLLLLNEKTSAQQMLGLCFSLAALCGILWLETQHSGKSTFRGISALVSAVIIHALMYVQCKKRGNRVSVLTYNALPCLAAGVALTLGGWWIESPQPAAFTQSAILAILWLGVVAGVGGILCYFALQQVARPFQASLVFLVFPVIAIALDNVVKGTSISPASLLLIFPLLVGILLTLKPQRAARKQSSISETSMTMQE